MPLQGSITTDDGVTHATAYAVCAEININFLAKHARTVINVYHSAAALAGGKIPIKQYAYSFNENAVDEVLNEEDEVVTQAMPAFDDLFDLTTLTEGETILTRVVDFVTGRTEFTDWSVV